MNEQDMILQDVRGQIFQVKKQTSDKPQLDPIMIHG